MQLPADCWGSSGAGKDLSSVINIEAARDRLLSRRPPTRTRVLYSRLSAAHSQLIDWLIATAIPSACCRRIVERGKSHVNTAWLTGHRLRRDASKGRIENCVSSPSESRQFNALRVSSRVKRFALRLERNSDIKGILGKWRRITSMDFVSLDFSVHNKFTNSLEDE